MPTDAELTTLADYLGGESVAGGKMKEAGTAHWNSPNTGADNSSGFTALPGGSRHYSGTFGDLGNGGLMWSATEGGSAGGGAWCRDVYAYNSSTYRYEYYKPTGFSVRCVGD